MTCTFSDHVLLRMPVQIPEAYGQSIQFFLDDPDFNAALFVASPVFFDSLQRKSFVADNLGEKELLTLKKYINRYCFRPTPFGLFSSVTLVKWGKETRQEPGELFMPVIRPDQVFIHRLLSARPDPPVNASYCCNPTLYRAMNELRFIRTGVDEHFKQREYQLQSVAYSRLLKDLIAFCRRGKERDEIANYIQNKAGCLPEEAEDYTAFLIDSQLILTEQGRNITGANRLADMARSNQPGLPSPELLSPEIKGLPTIAELYRFDASLNAFLQEDQRIKESPFSIVLHRTPADETLPNSYLGQLGDGLFALAALSQREPLPAMAQFANSFHEHFEGQLVPLLTVLDPEVGIGYQEPVKETANPLLETVLISFNAETPDNIRWTEAHRYLLENWQAAARERHPVIRLKKDELEKLRPAAQPLETLGMSVLFRGTGENVFIESAGGCNAPALAGRFTVGNPAITQAVLEMTNLLESANPDLIFAELLQLSDPHTDNINRREISRNYELPVTSSSTLPRERQIELSDLYVYVGSGKVLLYSKKHRKVVVPMLTSAYNHSLNRLPLFRFLADLPYQYGDYNLGIDMRQYFPKLRYYPRVVYRTVILSLATWVLDEIQVQALQDNSCGTAQTRVKRLAEEIDLPLLFSLAEGDQQIVFNRANSEEASFFIACISKKQSVVLKEYLEQVVVRQYNAFVLPANPILLPAPSNIQEQGSKAKRKFIPGSEWLYLKIYVPRIAASRLLLSLRPLLRKTYPSGKIARWFFIRYEDHSTHIRLRLKAPTAATGEILFAFKQKLEDRIQQHVLREYQVDTYSRELERYSAGGIELTEAVFWASSELVLQFLHQNRKETIIPAYHFGLFTTFAMISVFIREPDEQLNFTLGCYSRFLSEFSGNQIKVQLDKKFRELSGALNRFMPVKDAGLCSGSVSAGGRFIKSLEAVAANIKNTPAATLGYLQSLVHMHLNRVFTDDARKQEMITYYLLHKYLVSQKARNTKQEMIT